MTPTTSETCRRIENAAPSWVTMIGTSGGIGAVSTSKIGSPK
jgi:hypothetical protein